MQPIAPSIAPPSRPAGTAVTEQSPESADGFGALLAGLVAMPAPATEASSDSRPLTLAFESDGNAGNPADSAVAPLESGTIAPGATAPLGATSPADARPSAAAADAARARAPAAAIAGVPGAQVPTNPSAGSNKLDATPAGADDGDAAAAHATLAAGSTTARATGDAIAPAITGRPDGRSVGPQPAAGRPTSSAAAARLQQLAAGGHSQTAPALARAEHPAASAAGVTARPMLPVFTMAGMPGDLGRSDLQVSFGELADGSLLRGLATATAVGGEPPAASPAGGPSGAAVQPVRQLAAVIDRAVAGEIRQLTIQLSPQELGAIDIALSFDEERRLSVSILAERPETLELLKGESRQLERLLGRQGIDLADAGLELGLMSQERGGNGDTHASSGQQALAMLDERAGEAEPLPDDTPDPLPDGAAAALGAARRLNLSI
jgi:flagellar hook-length control protein FliK